MKNDTDCPNDQKNCYQAIEPLENVICGGFGKRKREKTYWIIIFESCSDNKCFLLSVDGAKFGVVVCTDSKNNTYYPISMFALEDGLCSFNNLTELELLEPSYNQLQLIISKPIRSKETICYDLCNLIENKIAIYLNLFSCK